MSTETTNEIECLICADGPEECRDCGASGESRHEPGEGCLTCGGSGSAIPDHCCGCGGDPYCVRCHTCGAVCAGDCRCPIEVIGADGKPLTVLS